MRLSNTKAGRAALGAAAAAGVKHMAHRFIIAESHRDVDGDLRGLWRHGVASSLDLLGEATVTAGEADAYADRAADAVRTIAAAAPRWPPRPRLEHDFAGPIPRANVSVKVSGLTPLLRPDAPERGKRDAAVRLRRLLVEARDRGAHLHIDTESVDSLDAVLELVLELLAEPELAEGPSAGIVLQAYLRESPDRLRDVLAWAQATPRAQPLTVRLVKGAYWDHEVVEARQHGWGVAGVRGQGGVRPELRGALAGAHRCQAARAHGHRLAQPALGRARDRLQPPDRRRRRRRRAAGPARPRRRPPGRARPRRLPRARLLPGGRPRGRHGLPRPPPAREHRQRVVPLRPAAGAPIEELLAAP